MQQKREILIIPHNHFDPSWRRCFDRSATLNGVTISSYAQVEKAVIDRWLEWEQPFTEGQAAVLRKYLEKSPQNKEKIIQWSKNDKFACPMTGETVQDSILPAPEGLIRNFLCSIPFYEDVTGKNHEAYKMVWAEDAFSNSPNYPQIIQGVGGDTICKISYKVPKSNVWTGLDGSSVAVFEKFFYEMSLGTFEKHPPCEHCYGEGCEKCQQTGMRFTPPIGYETIINLLEEAVDQNKEFLVFNVGGEEILPEKDLNKAVKDMQKKHPDIKFKIGTSLDIYKQVKPEIDKALENPSEFEDLDPVFQGCYVSRIKTKQRVRELTYRLSSIEGKLANKQFKNNLTEKPNEELAKAWKKIVFCQFHDIITGTMIDTAYHEAMDMLNEAEEVINSYDKVNTEVEKKEQQQNNSKIRKVTWGEHKLEFADCGILSVKTNGKELANQRGYGRLRRSLCIGELVVEPDAGDAWATRMCPTFSPADNQSMLPLGDFQKIAFVDEHCIIWEGEYTPKTAKEALQGYDSLINKLSWKTTAKFTNQMITFETHVDWDSNGRRLKVLFPVNSNSDNATYEIPFGYIDRKYIAREVDYHSWSPNYMEYAAQNWACKQIDENSGVAVLNKGLPCYRWVPGSFELSLLRSPQFHFVGNEPRNYDFNDFDELRDSGSHYFEYALLPYDNDLTPTVLSRIGLKYNQPNGLDIPFNIPENVLATAWKQAQDGNGCVLRFYNPSNKQVTGDIDFGKQVNVAKCNMLEQNEQNQEKSTKYKYKLRPFEICTIRIN